MGDQVERLSSHFDVEVVERASHHASGVTSPWRTHAAQRQYPVVAPASRAGSPRDLGVVVAVGEARAQERLVERSASVGSSLCTTPSHHRARRTPPLASLRALLLVLVARSSACTVWTRERVRADPGRRDAGGAAREDQGRRDDHAPRQDHADRRLSARRSTRWQWIVAALPSRTSSSCAANELVEPGVPTDELAAQGYLEMSDSKQAAEVAAFRALGWKTPATPTGAIVNAVGRARRRRERAGLHVADEIVAVNGTAVALVVRTGRRRARPRARHDGAPARRARQDLGDGRHHAGARRPRSYADHRSPRRVRSVRRAAPGSRVATRRGSASRLEDGVSYGLPATSRSTPPTSAGRRRDSP